MADDHDKATPVQKIIDLVGFPPGERRAFACLDRVLPDLLQGLVPLQLQGLSFVGHDLRLLPSLPLGP